MTGGGIDLLMFVEKPNRMAKWSEERLLFIVRFWILLKIAGEEIILSIMLLVFVLLSQCVGLLLSAIKRSGLYKVLFNAIPHLFDLVQLKSVCFALRSPVMKILSAESSILSSSVMLIVEAGGM